MNDPVLCAAAHSLALCCVPSAAEHASVSGGDTATIPEIIRNAKGRFPADLNQLRGQLSLEASVGDPVVCALECNTSTILIAACDDKDFYGIWNQGKWTPVKADQLYGSAFSTLVQKQLNGAGASANIWSASFLVFPATVVQEEESTPAPPAAPTKKKVVRKRPLAIPVVTTTTEDVAATTKKQATDVEHENEIDL